MRFMPCPPVSFESAATTSTDAGISSRQSNRNRQNSCSLVKTVSKSATFLLQFPAMSDAACNSRDVLFTHNLGKRNREPQPAPASRSYLHGISGRYAADTEIRRPVAHSLGAGGNICCHGDRLGRHFLRSVCRCSWHLLRALCPCVWDAVAIGFFAAQSAFSDRCTRNDSRHSSSGVECCVSCSSCEIPIAFTVLRCFSGVCVRNRDCPSGVLYRPVAPHCSIILKFH